MDSEQLRMHAPHSTPRGNFCRFDGRVLSRPFDEDEPSPLTKFVHDSFRGLVLNERFSCVAGRAAVRQNAYRFGLYAQLGSPSSSADLACDLARFASDPGLSNEPLRAFAASFVDPVPRDELHFEQLMWATLQQLNDIDKRPWAMDCHSDPADPHFAFSFGGTGFFLVGLHARSSRLARRFAWSTLVFNPHEQFERLRREDRYSRFREVIRARDVELQGTVNPMLQDFGERSEARQYSGRPVSEDWQCPFRARGHHVKERE